MADAIEVAARIGRGVLVALFVVSLVALVYYLFKGYIPEFHTDSAVKSLLAEEAIRQGSYFPPEWNYVNGDLWVLFGQIFIIPLLPFFKNSYWLHAISGLISSAIVLTSLWCVSGMVVRSRWMRLLTVTIFAGGVSWFVAENLFGQVSYGNVLYLAVFTLYFAWRWLESSRRRGRIGWALALFVLSALTAWGNPQRAAAYNLAPMLAAILAWASTRDALLVWVPGARRWQLTGDSWRIAGLLAILFGAMVVGVTLHSIAIAHVHNNAGAGSARWLSFEAARENLWFTLQGILGMFGALPSPERSVMSLGGAYEGARLLGILVMLVMLPVACCMALRDLRPSARMLGAFAASGLCMFVFLQVTTTTPDMTGPSISARYMLPSLILGVVLLVGYAENRGVRRPGGIIAWGVLLVLLSSMLYAGNSFTRIYRGTPPSVHVQTMEALKAAGLQYGYASYWNSGVITILSGGDVKVRQIDFLRGLPVPRPHLASNTWYRSDAWKGESFLMLTSEEVAQVDKAVMFAFTGEPLRQFMVGGFLVLVFKDNIATKLPGWGVEAAQSRHIGEPLGITTQHEIGRLENEGGRLRLLAAEGETGFLHFGPYVKLQTGEYRVDVDVVAPGSGEVGYVDVVSGLGAKVLGKSPITGGAASPVSLRIATAEDLENVEVRVYTNGSSAMTLSSITLAPADAAKLPE
ncbi:hypothetical protein INQ40_10845 [Lysobacter sp. H21R4]|uniref:hypothetical protein n=1 Tax=Lysobacter sp. H21R4 TaxID=2781021 RepID=UPI0018898FDE|nr:hypothetical protein [Lysobacter sp. H21R4]QOY62384.1 hypothetical protein INQ40_10845 [Lysobacter sp. H21R4]